MFGVRSEVFCFMLLKSIGVGFLLAVVYGALILARKAGLRHPVLVFFQDVGFAAFSAVVTFAFLYAVNAGVPRLFLFFGESVGFFSFFLYKLQDT